jgi:metal-sulfur cluster biosynthetic enzyme
VTRQEVIDTLRHVYDPDYFDRSIVDMGLVTEEDVEITGERVNIWYKLSAPICPFSAAIGLMIRRALESKLGIIAEVRIKPGHYQEDVVNEVLSSEEKARDLLEKMESYGVLERCIRW